MVATIRIKTEPGRIVLTSSGLKKVAGAELRAIITESRATETAETILSRAAAQLDPAAQENRQSFGTREVFWIRDGEWVDGYELDESRRLALGIQRVAGAFGAQSWVCAAYHAEFAPCRDTDAVAFTKEVLAGWPRVEGTRYDAVGDNQSGWILIHDTFDGGASDLERAHVHALVEARPDLERFFALPSGWRFFRTPDGENVYPVGQNRLPV